MVRVMLGLLALSLLATLGCSGSGKTEIPTNKLETTKNTVNLSGKDDKGGGGFAKPPGTP
jgi:hypothetical protein